MVAKHRFFPLKLFRRRCGMAIFSTAPAAARIKACGAVLAAVLAPVQFLSANPGSSPGTTPPAVWNIRLAQLAPAAGGSFIRLQNVVIQRWTGAGLRVADAAGHVQVLSVSQVMSIRRPGAGSSPAVGWQVVLRDGSVIVGKPRQLSAGRLIVFSPAMGRISISLTQVAAVRDGPLPAITPVAEPVDTLYLTNGATLAGAMNTMGRQHVQWSTSLGNATVPWSRVRYMRLGGPKGAMAVHGLAQRVTLTDGTVLIVRNLIRHAGLAQCMVPGMGQIHFPVLAMVRMSVLGGDAQWLAGVPAVKAVQISWFGPPDQWPMQPNRCVMGTLLMAGGRRFTHGIGMHAKASVTYDLGGHYSHFVFSPAMDQSAAPQGRAVAVVELDGKVIWRSGVLRPDTPPEMVNLSVTGGLTLTLQVTDPGGFCVRSRMDWLNAVLLRK